VVGSLSFLFGLLRRPSRAETSWDQSTQDKRRLSVPYGRKQGNAGTRPTWAGSKLKELPGLL